MGPHVSGPGCCRVGEGSNMPGQKAPRQLRFVSRSIEDPWLTMRPKIVPPLAHWACSDRRTAVDR